MPIKEICTYDVVTLDKDASLQEAANLMKKNNVGYIVIVEGNDANKKPCGVITDRDIVIKVLADNVDINKCAVADVMSAKEDLLTLNHNDGIKEAIDAMREKGVRRSPIVNEQDELVGVVSADDLFMLLANELSSVSKLIEKQIAIQHSLQHFVRNVGLMERSDVKETLVKKAAVK